MFHLVILSSNKLTEALPELGIPYVTPIRHQQSGHCFIDTLIGT